MRSIFLTKVAIVYLDIDQGERWRFIVKFVMICGNSRDVPET